MSRGMVSFLTGLGGGYLKADQQRSQNERQAKQDAQNTQLHDARMLEITAAQDARTEESNFKVANIAAQSAGKQDAGYQVTDDAGSSGFTKDADAAAMLGDMAAAKNTGVDTLAATRVSTGAQGATMAGTIAGNKVFTDPTQAASFAQDNAMSSWMKMKSRQDVADQFGKMDLSDDIRGKLQKLESEGAFKAFALAQNGDYAGAAKMYQDTGSSRLPKGATFTGAEVEDPTTKLKRNVISVIGADGAPIVQDLDKALRSYLSPTEQYTMGKGDRQEARQATQDEQGQDRWRKEFGLKEAEANSKASLRASQAENRLLRTRMATGPGSTSSQQPGFNPLGNFDAKQAQSVAFKQAAEAMGPDGGPLSPMAQGQLAQQIYRSMEDSFSSENTSRERARVFRQAAGQARTPEDVQVVRARAAQSGYSDQEMAQLDPRFTPAKAQDETKNPPAHPPPGGMEDTVRKTFNEAGYTDTQSTIDGARRGDKNALLLLKKLEARGVTTPSQRQQIEKITSGQ